MYHGDGVTDGGRTFTKKELNASSVKEANALLKARGKEPITASRWKKLKTLHKQKSDERQEKKKKKQTKAKATAQTKAKATAQTKAKAPAQTKAKAPAKTKAKAPAKTKAKEASKKSQKKGGGAKRNAASQQLTMSF